MSTQLDTAEAAMPPPGHDKRPRGPEVDSFYHLAGVDIDHKFCRGLGCFAAQHLDPDRWRKAMAQWPPVFCLGKCYSAPSSADEENQPLIEIRCKDPIVLAGVPGGEVRSLKDYGPYRALEKARAMPPCDVVSEIEKSQLRGRGGAAFPTGRKWRAVFDQPGPVKYVVANADEGDHGSYIDRYIMENAPHRLIEALAIAGYALGATKGVIYLRKEYPIARAALEEALTEARSAGWLDPMAFDISLTIGQGSYVCGEETSLLNSIEHRRPEVRARPPYPFQAGLWSKPTLVNNVETLASVPWIVLNGGDAFAARGFSTSRGTKAVSFSSLFKRPGLYEIDFGMSLRELFYEVGGGLKNGDFKAVIIGGPLAGAIHPREFETPFAIDELAAIGAAVGHGGIVGFDDHTHVLDLLAHIFSFGSQESCGKCTPCRVGSRRAEVFFWRMARGDKLKPEERDELRAILLAMRKTSLCGHGSGLGEVAQSILSKFPQEVPLCLA
ncbi:MAG TPA: NADH-ubiquinone oxidoreductase-F iron-sulfur binding region domain-containing protein [Fimbriimonadaceae bacterium]|nr:NADH-ubiquinone oxidoreductase-F iron-sulfur binding region domain-containing protein [Fimbriimonadaceae bacterium]